MTDLRSFVRYLVPGITFLVELALLLAAANPKETILLLGGSLRAADIGSIFGAALALGGLGYLIGAAHHSLCWSSVGPWYNAVDLREVLQRLQVRNFLVLELQDGPEATTQNIVLSPAGSWRVFTALWHSRRETSSRIKGATPRADSLSDLMHGAGSALIACVLAIVVALSVASAQFIDISRCTALAVSMLLLLIHWKSYRHAGAQARGFAELVLFEELSSVSPASPSAATLATTPTHSESASQAFVLRISRRELDSG
ncbi:MAG: hypothetical protein KIS62_13605 [Ramlibacter sp.]|nr:hypothetical protein [Ramlibacter sp.]